MRFWQKIFISTFILFFIIFDLGAYVLVSYSSNFMLSREIDGGVREQSVILSAIQTTILEVESVNMEASKDDVRLNAIVKPLADFYKDQGVTIALYRDNSLVYSNTPNISSDLLNSSDNKKNILNQKIDNKRYLFVASLIPSYNNLTLVYVKDISPIDTFSTNISRLFIILTAIMCVVIGLSIFFLLKRLTKPINKLNETTKMIAMGAYNERVLINRKDELGELGEIFNLMADSVEVNIQKLEKASEDKQFFIDNLAHEIRTPITTILGYSEYLKNALNSEEERILATDHLHVAAKRIQNLSVRLLDFAYMNDEINELHSIDIQRLFEILSNLMDLPLKNQEMKLETEARINELIGDETLILSLLTNLVENAARASKANATINVKAYFDEYPIIEVIDEGYGIPADEIAKITEPFYRIDKSRSRAFGGVGLGLSLCKLIAKQHHAKLEIKSTLGVGTSVRIIFTTL